MGISDHLTCLLRNLYAGQEAAVRTGHGTMDWFQIGEGVWQDCIFSPYLFNLYSEYIIRNSAWIKLESRLCVCVCVCSVAQLCLTLGPHELQHTRIPCPSPSPRVCSNLSPLSQWCHPTISSPVIPLSSCLQSFPASGSFPVGQLFASSGQIIGLSASASILQMNIQGWFPLGLTGTMQSTSCEMPGWMNPKL